MIQFSANGDWYGCYGKSWKGIITDESFSHPAKFSRGLIYRIYQYLKKLIIPEDTIFDPFAGVSLGALPALQAGYNWLGLELETNFVSLGQENLALWESRYRGKLPGWQGEAILFQGDSRRLTEVLQDEIGAVISSPPYAGGSAHTGGNDPNPRYIQGGRTNIVGLSGDKATKSYGDTEGQLGNIPEGDFSAIVTSPPFAGNSGGRGEASRNGIDAALFDRHQGAMVGGIGDKASGNLGSLPQTDFQAVVTSPPYENSVNQSSGANDTEARIGRMRQADIDVSQKVNVGGANGVVRQAQVYGNSNGQIGATSGNTFWSAARLILEQCYQVLQPGGVAVFVCKDFVKSGTRLPFSDQWSQLCVAVGFEPMAHFRAWLVKPGPIQTALIGEDMDHTKEHKSFFRRLAEQKGSPRIDWEDVVIFRKP